MIKNHDILKKYRIIIISVQKLVETYFKMIKFIDIGTSRDKAWLMINKITSYNIIDIGKDHGRHGQYRL